MATTRLTHSAAHDVELNCASARAMKASSERAYTSKASWASHHRVCRVVGKREVERQVRVGQGRIGRIGWAGLGRTGVVARRHWPSTTISSGVSIVSPRTESRGRSREPLRVITSVVCELLCLGAARVDGHVREAEGDDVLEEVRALRDGT